MATGIGASGVICFRTYNNEWYRFDLNSLSEEQEGKELSPIAILDLEVGADWTIIGEDIYVTGGAVSLPDIHWRAISNALYKHGPTENPDEWQVISRGRKFPHSHSFVFAINRKIYVIGGYDIMYKLKPSNLDSKDLCPEKVSLEEKWTYGGEVYDIDNDTWNGVASTWKDFPEFCGAFGARLDKDRVVFYASINSSLLFYDAANDKLSSEFHPNFKDVYALPHPYILLYSIKNIPALGYDSTLYWLCSDLHLYGYDTHKRIWFRSMDGLENTTWPISFNSDYMLAHPVLINLDDKGNFVAIFATNNCELGIASFAVHKDSNSLTLSLKTTHTLTVPPHCYPSKAMLMNVGG